MSTLKEKEWDFFLKKQLDFNSKSIFDSEGKNEISFYECNDKSKIISIDSEPYTSDLKLLNNKDHTIFIVNSLSDLYLTNTTVTLQSKNGISNILSSDSKFRVISPFRRKSVSIILDTTNYIDYDDRKYLNCVLWQNSMKIPFGSLVDRFMNDLYQKNNDKKKEKIKNIIGSTIALSIEKDIHQKTKKIEMFDTILNVINSNHKDNNFSLTSLSAKIGVTPKTIQNILNKYNIKFYSYLQTKRCFSLKILLDNNIYYNFEYLAIQAGFKSFIAADRQFHILFNVSIKQYMKSHLDPLEKSF
ncbi:hypothetical protein VXS03_17985 [Photobacterium sp. S4TG1]|uniref:hypothetical protein n=1 Tax=Photobacterium sp. S4TG1 TaxID=3114587 RepID=UPI002E18E5D7|nr:hypothetical protein [Photobacterium sp. S4TG1]